MCKHGVQYPLPILVVASVYIHMYLMTACPVRSDKYEVHWRMCASVGSDSPGVRRWTLCCCEVNFGGEVVVSLWSSASGEEFGYDFGCGYVVYCDVAFLDVVLYVVVFDVYEISTFDRCCVFGYTDRRLIVNLQWCWPCFRLLDICE